MAYDATKYSLLPMYLIWIFGRQKGRDGAEDDTAYIYAESPVSQSLLLPSRNGRGSRELQLLCARRCRMITRVVTLGRRGVV